MTEHALDILYSTMLYTAKRRELDKLESWLKPICNLLEDENNWKITDQGNLQSDRITLVLNKRKRLFGYTSIDPKANRDNCRPYSPKRP